MLHRKQNCFLLILFQFSKLRNVQKQIAYSGSNLQKEQNSILHSAPVEAMETVLF